MPDNENTDRRTFLGKVLGLAGLLAAGAVVYPIIRFLVPPKMRGPGIKTVNVAAVDEIPANSGMIFPVGNTPGILIRTPGGELRAFTAICTHLGCTVQYRKDLQHIWCACHNGHFDLRGRNIKGPPPNPLKEYEVNVMRDRIFVTVDA